MISVFPPAMLVSIFPSLANQMCLMKLFSDFISSCCRCTANHHFINSVVLCIPLMAPTRSALLSNKSPETNFLHIYIQAWT